jgi:ABC-type polysaccharide/polyol phosphate export permease
MGILQGVRACYDHRALIQNLVGRQLRARYRGSVLGFLWTFLNPLLLMLVYSLVFTVYMRVGMKNYGAFVFSGLLPWLWFVSSLSEGAVSIVASGNLVTKAMFPPEVLPVVAVLTNLMNYVLSLPVLVAILLISGVPIGVPIVALPLIMAVQLLLTLGAVFLLSALNVQYRDVQFILMNLLTFWFFLCPILYPLANVPPKLHVVALANLMGSLVVAYQDVLFYNRFPAWDRLLLVALAGVAILVIGYGVFSRNREAFAEWL